MPIHTDKIGLKGDIDDNEDSGCLVDHYWISAKCILVTGSLWECLRAVGPESQGSQIPEFAGPMEWPSGAPGSTWER